VGPEITKFATGVALALAVRNLSTSGIPILQSPSAKYLHVLVLAWKITQPLNSIAAQNRQSGHGGLRTLVQRRVGNHAPSIYAAGCNGLSKMSLGKTANSISCSRMQLSRQTTILTESLFWGRKLPHIRHTVVDRRPRRSPFCTCSRKLRVRPASNAGTSGATCCCSRPPSTILPRF